MSRRNATVNNEEVQCREDKALASKSDLRGVLAHAEQRFYRAAWYGYPERLNKNHNVVRYPDMPTLAFADVQEHLKQIKFLHQRAISLYKRAWVGAHQQVEELHQVSIAAERQSMGSLALNRNVISINRVSSENLQRAEVEANAIKQPSAKLVSSGGCFAFG